MHWSHRRGRAVPGICGCVALELMIACGPTGPADSAGTGTSTGGTTGSSGAGAESDTGTEPTGTGGPTETEEAACAKMCEAYATCWPGADVEKCRSTCAWWWVQGYTAACRDAAATSRLCLATLTCAELLGDYNRTDCEDELAAESEHCTPGRCAVHGTLGIPDADCGSAQGCSGLPARGVYCTGETCTCTLDGVKGPSCQAPAGACDKLPPPPIEFSECCGFGP